MADLEAKLRTASELQKQPKSNGEQPLILVRWHIFNEASWFILYL